MKKKNNIKSVRQLQKEMLEQHQQDEQDAQELQDVQEEMVNLHMKNGQSEEHEMSKTTSVRNKVISTRKKKDIFDGLRMWIYLFACSINKERGRIPQNIGNKILITSNMYATSIYLSSIIQVLDLGLETPTTFLQTVTDYLRTHGSKAIIDCTLKTTEQKVNLKDDGLQSRIRVWEKMADNEFLPEKQKKKTAQCLYTVSKLKEGAKLREVRMFITIRAKTGTELKLAEGLIGEFISMVDGQCRIVTDGIGDVLEYISIIGDHATVKKKEIQYLVCDNLTLAQLLPNTMGIGDEQGILFGVNILNNSLYRLNFDSITVGRNMYIIAPSGVGKTVLCLNAFYSALERKNWRGCGMDIKGNELSQGCKAVGGMVIDVTAKSREYINTFRMDSEACTYENSKDYYSSNLDFSKKQLITLTGFSTKDEINELDRLLDEFFNVFYIKLGVTPYNKNSWEATKHITPYDVYRELVNYCSPSIMQKYKTVTIKALDKLKQYMTPSGSKSYIYKNEFDITQVYNSKCIVFNFGLLTEKSVSDVDADIFDFKFMQMQYIENKYVLNNFNNGYETFSILEESQIVPEKTLAKYAEQYTMRRSLRQTTWLLGNSIQALLNKKESQPIIENVRGLLIGDLNEKAREEVIKQFDLEEYRPYINLIGSSDKYMNSFLFINKMSKSSTVPIIKLPLGDDRKWVQFLPERVTS